MAGAGSGPEREAVTAAILLEASASAATPTPLAGARPWRRWPPSTRHADQAERRGGEGPAQRPAIGRRCAPRAPRPGSATPMRWKFANSIGAGRAIHRRDVDRQVRALPDQDAGGVRAHARLQALRCDGRRRAPRRRHRALARPSPSITAAVRGSKSGAREERDRLEQILGAGDACPRRPPRAPVRESRRRRAGVRSSRLVARAARGPRTAARARGRGGGATRPRRAAAAGGSHRRLRSTAVRATRVRKASRPSGATLSSKRRPHSAPVNG